MRNEPTVQEKYEHFLAYAGLRDTPLLRYAYHHGAGVGLDRPQTEPLDQEPLGYVTSEGLAKFRELNGCTMRPERDADHLIPVYANPVTTPAAQPNC